MKKFLENLLNQEENQIFYRRNDIDENRKGKFDEEKEIESNFQK